MKDFAKWFYGSNEWKNCRDTYSRSVGRLCELCAKQGRITPAEIIHRRGDRRFVIDECGRVVSLDETKR